MNRATAAIAQQMQFTPLGTLRTEMLCRAVVPPAFGFADAAPVACVFLTPLAAIRCVLTWLASRANASKIRYAFAACKVRNTVERCFGCDECRFSLGQIRLEVAGFGPESEY